MYVASLKSFNRNYYCIVPPLKLALRSLSFFLGSLTHITLWPLALLEEELDFYTIVVWEIS